MSEGWICLHRGWRDNPVFRGEFSRADAWVWMIETACWKPTRFDIRGKIVTLERGQFCATIRQLAEVWGWSKSSVERFLTRLETETMIELEPGHAKSVITICNYAKYQDVSNPERDKVGTATGTKLGQSWDIKEQGNKETIEEEDTTVSPSPARAGAAKADPLPKSDPKPKKVAMTADWAPAPLPASVAPLVAQWPPGRLQREIDQFRDYWIDRGDKRPGWDRSFHNRIRDIHDRVLREHRNDRTPQNFRSAAPIDRRDGFERAIDRRLSGLGPDDASGPVGRHDAGPGGGDSEFPIARVVPLR